MDVAVVVVACSTLICAYLKMSFSQIFAALLVSYRVGQYRCLVRNWPLPLHHRPGLDVAAQQSRHKYSSGNLWCCCSRCCSCSLQERQQLSDNVICCCPCCCCVWHVVVAAATLVIAFVRGDPQQVPKTHDT